MEVIHIQYTMSKTVSARISNSKHRELLERCNLVGCTINEWINEAIQYVLTASSEFDFGFNAAADGSGGVHITGYTNGDLAGNSNAGEYDAFLTKYDAGGNRVWTQLLGGGNAISQAVETLASAVVLN